jgi:hypothetical protein
LTRRKEPETSHSFHAMLLYSDEANRDLILSPILDRVIRENSMLSFIISGSSGRSKPLIDSIRKRYASFKRKTLIVDDAAALHTRGRTPEDSYFRLFEANRRKFESGRYGSWTHMGDWAHTFYHRIENVMDIERSLARQKGERIIFCCFREEGFASLNLAVLVELLELHNQVIFPAKTFNWTPKLSPA